jgi:hypothetical protein
MDTQMEWKGIQLMKQSTCVYFFLALFMLAVNSVRAEEIFFDDSMPQAMVPPLLQRWVPGHDGGICSSSTAGVGSLCGPGTFSEESVWGALLAPSAGATVDTNIAHYHDRGLDPIPFNGFLWITEQQNAQIDLYSDYLYSDATIYSDAIYLQFNSAFEAGFHCTTACGQPFTIAEQNGKVTAGYILWSDGNVDQVTFMSTEEVPEPSSLLLLATGFILLFWSYCKVHTKFA